MIIKAEDIELGDVMIIEYFGIEKMLKVLDNPIRSPNTPDKIYFKVQEIKEDGFKVGPPAAQSFMADSPIRVFPRFDLGWGDVEYESLEPLGLDTSSVLC